jgi:hypothetical protein
MENEELIKNANAFSLELNTSLQKYLELQVPIPTLMAVLASTNIDLGFVGQQQIIKEALRQLREEIQKDV